MTNPQFTSNSTYSTGSSLSVGVKARVGVGVAFRAIALIAALFLARKSLAKKRASSNHHQRRELTDSHVVYKASNNNKPIAELSQGPRYLAAELPHPQQYFKLPRVGQDPVELEDTAVRNR
jgi:hypothetical protein